MSSTTLSPYDPINRSNLPIIRRILVMESDANLRHIYKQALTGAGYDVYLALTLQDARILIAGSSFDLFLSDIHMNGQDQGLELLQEQSALLTENGTKIIMMSCEAQYRAICEEMGADAFIEKPVAIDRLVTIVDRLLTPQ